MRFKTVARVLCALALLLSGTASQAAVSWTYTLTNQGNGLYSYRFQFVNSNNQPEAIFKIHFDSGAIPREWTTYGWTVPQGWSGVQSGTYIDLQTGNGSTPQDGYYRIFSKPGAPSPCMGWTTQNFVWTFASNGGPAPTADFFRATDIKVHLQPLNADWSNNGSTYWVNPSSVPEPASLLAFLAGLGGLAVRRRRVK